MHASRMGQRGYGGNQWCCCSPNNDAKRVLIQSLLLKRGKGGASPTRVSAVASMAESVSGEAVRQPLALLP